MKIEGEASNIFSNIILNKGLKMKIEIIRNSNEVYWCP